MKRSIFFCLISIGLLFSCQSDPLPGLESAFSTAPSKEAATALIAAYQTRLMNPTAGDNTTDLLGKLKTMLSNNGGMLDASALTEKLGSSTIGIDTMLARLSTQFFMKDGKQEMNKEAILSYQNAAEIRAMISPDEESVKKILSAGEAARTMREYPKAIGYFDMILQKFPNMKGASQALFLKAFTMDNDLKQIDRARSIYQEFLQKYPEDGFADDVQFLLQNLGATNEEIIQRFEKADETSKK